jgi:hypothetical protein
MCPSDILHFSRNASMCSRDYLNDPTIASLDWALLTVDEAAVCFCITIPSYSLHNMVTNHINAVAGVGPSATSDVGQNG